MLYLAPVVIVVAPEVLKIPLAPRYRRTPLVGESVPNVRGPPEVVTVSVLRMPFSMFSPPVVFSANPVD